MRNKKLFAKSNIILLLILLVLIGTVIFISLSVREDNVQKKLSEGTSISFIFNITSKKDILFSEVFIYHPGTHRTAVIDIPVNYGSLIKSLSRVDRLDVLYKKGKPKMPLSIGNPQFNFIQSKEKKLSIILEETGP